MSYRYTLSCLILCSLLLGGLSGCNYLIPDDPSVPRYNTVIGERHKPLKNSGEAIPEALLPPMGAPAQQSAAALAPMPAAAPVSEVAMSNLPAPAPAMSMERRAPAENGFATAQNEVNPGLMNVPPRPEMNGADSAQARLGVVRQELEEERLRAQMMQNKLARDAAAEPSMLPQPAPPVSLQRATPSEQPVTPGAMNMNMPQPAAPMPPRAPQQNAGYIAPIGLMPPPPPPSSMANAMPAPSPMPSYSANAMTPMPVASPAVRAPIILRPPVGSGATSQSFSSMPQSSTISSGENALLPAAPGGFNPLTGAPRLNSASSGFLEDSRYAARR